MRVVWKRDADCQFADFLLSSEDIFLKVVCRTAKSSFRWLLFCFKVVFVIFWPEDLPYSWHTFLLKVHIFVLELSPSIHLNLLYCQVWFLKAKIWYWNSSPKNEGHLSSTHRILCYKMSIIIGLLLSFCLSSQEHFFWPSEMIKK